jgi:heme A synthase
MRRLAPSLPTLAWIALAANLVVILQGAVVRITHSGAGCGRHWPLCNGEVIPLAPTLETSIEFGHRLLSLVVLVIGTWLLVKAFRARREMPGTFAFATASFVFLIIEALLGALTVLWGLTADNASVERGLMVASHLVNSMLLVGALSGTVWYATGRGVWPLRLRRQGVLGTTLAVAFGGMLLLMFSGGIAAMGNTMFPSASLAEGLAADFDPTSHPLIRLRILHPLIAVTVGIYLFVSLGFGWWLKPAPEARGPARALLGTYLTQLGIGTFNLALLAPVALQLLHLGVSVLAFGLLTVTAVAMLGSATETRAARPLRRSTLENAG